MNPLPSARHRAGVITFVEDRLVVIDRIRPGRSRYQVLPGGGVQPGETLAQAAVREVAEETGLKVEVTHRPVVGVRRDRDTEWLFLATVVGGELGTGHGPEFTQGRPGRGSYEPMLVSRAELAGLHLLPLPVAEVVAHSWSSGVWATQPRLLDDPLTKAPVRVRAAAVVLRGPAMLLIERQHRGERWFEIPGGGVEAGETPLDAVIRELREETGLSATVDRELATVYKDGRRGHYFLVDASGELGARSELDLDPDAQPVWLPLTELATAAVWPKRLAWRIAQWRATGWPAEPVQLCDSIVDLNLACDW